MTGGEYQDFYNSTNLAGRILTLPRIGNWPERGCPSRSVPPSLTGLNGACPAVPPTPCARTSPPSGLATRCGWDSRAPGQWRDAPNLALQQSLWG